MKKELMVIIIFMLLVGTAITAIGQVKINTIIKSDKISNIFNNGDKWIKTYDYYDFDFGDSVQQTSDEGFILVGSSYPSTGNSVVWLVKTDYQGNILWEKIFGGKDDDYGSSVKQTKDGGYIIAGRTWSYGSGKGDIWLIKADSMGNMVWNKTFNYIGWDFGNDVIQTDDNGYVIVGWIGKPDESDAVLIKTDEFGNLEWESTFGYSYGDGAYSVAQTLDGGYIVSGYTFKDENSFDIWLFKTNSDGELLWDKTFFTDDESIGFSVKSTDDGGFIITGVISPPYIHKLKSYINGKNPLYWNSEIDMLLFKIDSDGELLWYNRFGGDDESWGEDVYQTNDGGYIVIGTSGGFYRENALLIKTNSEGEEIWSKTYGNRFSAEITLSGQQTKDGGFILAGYKYSYSKSDFLLIKTDSNGNVVRNKTLFRPNPVLFERFINLFSILKMMSQQLIY